MLVCPWLHGITVVKDMAGSIDTAKKYVTLRGVIAMMKAGG
jgi:hypothetical protein